MKNFLKQHGVWVLFAAAVLSVSLALMAYFSNTSAPLVNFANTITAPFRSTYTAIAGWFSDKQGYYEDNSALKEENQALKKQIAKMEADIRQAEADSAENERLRKLLNLREQRREFDLESAFVTSHSTSNWTSSLTLDKGTNHGVAANDCVINEEGYLVGVISEVGLNWCTVLNITDTDTSLGAQVFRTGEIGVAEGDFTLMGEGRLKLSFLPADTKLLNGDLVVTSGLGGYYPSGLVIGSVEEVNIDDSGAAEYAVLAPMLSLDDLTEVFIIKSFEIVN